MSQDPIDRDEMEALLAARQELGPSMEPALVDSFAQKIMVEIQRQSQMQQQIQPQTVGTHRSGTGPQLTLAIVSLVMAIPLTAIALEAGAWMAVVCWIGIVLVNFALAWRQPGSS